MAPAPSRTAERARKGVSGVRRRSAQMCRADNIVLHRKHVPVGADTNPVDATCLTNAYEGGGLPRFPTTRDRW